MRPQCSESVGSAHEAKQPGKENVKIACARRHFGAIEVDYGDVTGVEELRRGILGSRD